MIVTRIDERITVQLATAEEREALIQILESDISHLVRWGSGELVRHKGTNAFGAELVRRLRALRPEGDRSTSRSKIIDRLNKMSGTQLIRVERILSALADEEGS